MNRQVAKLRKGNSRERTQSPQGLTLCSLCTFAAIPLRFHLAVKILS